MKYPELKSCRCGWCNYIDRGKKGDYYCKHFHAVIIPARVKKCRAYKSAKKERKSWYLVRKDDDSWPIVRRSK